jgi:flagellar biosynthesis protein FliR
VPGEITQLQPATLDQALAFVPAYAAVLIRVSGLFIASPLFAASRVPKRVKALMAMAISWCVCLSMVPNIAWPATLGGLVASIAGELCIGIAVGMCANIMFAGVQWAGEIVGQQLGFNLGEVFDPQFASAGNVIGDLFYMLMLVIFLVIGGHHALLTGLGESFRTLPLLSVSQPGAGGGAVQGVGILETLVGIVGSSTILSIRLAGPVLTTLLILDVALGFIGKTMPQLNVLSAGMSLRSLIGIALLAGGLLMTGDAMVQAITMAMQSAFRLWHVQSVATVLSCDGVCSAALSGGVA